MFLPNPMNSYQSLHEGHLKNFFIRLVTKSINTEHLSEFLRQVKILSLKSISILLKPFLRNPKRSLFLYYLFNQWPWLLSIYNIVAMGVLSISYLRFILISKFATTSWFSLYLLSQGNFLATVAVPIYIYFFCHTFSSTISATRHLLSSRAT